MPRSKKRLSKKETRVGKKNSNKQYVGFNTSQTASVYSGFNIRDSTSYNGFNSVSTKKASKGLDKCLNYLTQKTCNKDPQCFFNGVTERCNPKCNLLSDKDCNYHSDVCQLNSPGKCVGKINPRKKAVKSASKNKGASKNKSEGETNSPYFVPPPRSNELDETITHTAKPIQSRPTAPLDFEFIGDAQPKGSSAKKNGSSAKFIPPEKLPAPPSHLLNSVSNSSSSSKKKTVKSSSTRSTSKKNSTKGKPQSLLGQIQGFKKGALKKVPTSRFKEEIQEMLNSKITNKSEANLLKKYFTKIGSAKLTGSNQEILNKMAKLMKKLETHALTLSKKKKVSATTVSELKANFKKMIEENKELQKLYRRQNINNNSESDENSSNNWSETNSSTN